MRTLLLSLLLSLPALAADRYLGTINVAGGASTNNFSTGNTKADGTAGAITLPGAAGRAVEVRLQCDVAVRVKVGQGNTTAAANSGANKGPKIDAEMLYALFLRTNAIAVIPASGSGAAACDLYQHVE